MYPDWHLDDKNTIEKRECAIGFHNCRSDHRSGRETRRLVAVVAAEVVP